MIWIVIASIVLIVVICIQYFRAGKITKSNVLCFSGTLGSGKSFMMVRTAMSKYKLQRLKHWVYTWFKPIKLIIPESEYPATLYSNIPIAIRYKKHGKRRGVVEWSTPFTREHLLMTEKLPERCIVVIDEFGAMASQYEFNNPYVMEYVQLLVRFFRHFTDGFLIVSDQMSGDIVKQVRERLGMIYYLHEFRRWFGILPFFKVNFIPLLNVEDTSTDMTQDTEKVNEQFFFGWLPYKWQKSKRRYASRCYKPLYFEAGLRTVDEWHDYYTTYLIDISVSQREQQDYKSNKDKWREFIYTERR